METVWTALILTTIAGLSTTIGAVLGILNKTPSPRFISFILALSGGVMVLLSFVEMFIPAWKMGAGSINEKKFEAYALLFLAIGLGIGFLFDIILPKEKNVHEHIFNGILLEVEDPDNSSKGGNRSHIHGHQRRNRHQHKEMYRVDEKTFMKLGILTMMALFLHNLPEGLATFSAALLDPTLGIEIAVATAMHNIPEGISVALPIYLATRSKKKAVFYAFASGLAEPVGGLIAYGIIFPFLSSSISTMVLNFLLSLTAGIMIYISVDVLIPTAKMIEYKHTSIIGFTLGMILIGITIIFL